VSPHALAGTTWRDWEQTALDALDRLRAQSPRVVVAGLSMGGLLAARLAVLRPDQVRAIVMMAVPLWFPPIQTRFVRLLARSRLALAMPKFAGSDVRDAAARHANPSYRQFPLRAVNQMIELMDTVRDQLAQVHVPTLIAHGRHDHTADPACASFAAAKIGAHDVRLRWFARSYHLLPIDEEREQLATLVGDYVEEMLGR
jgi:carboxylesterase